MKKTKEIISLNSINDEFNNEMGIDERFRILSFSDQQTVKGGTDPNCPTMDNCLCMNGVVWGSACPEDCSCNGLVCVAMGCYCDGYSST